MRQLARLAHSRCTYRFSVSLPVLPRAASAATVGLDALAELLDTGVIELALTGDIALLAVELKNLHGDPADRFIAATDIAHDATLMTADARLLRWRSEVRRQNAQT
jgi:predicted nucleic acid-binding protein